MNTVMLNLQALAAAVSQSQAAADMPDGGTSFSDMLATAASAAGGLPVTDSGDTAAQDLQDLQADLVSADFCGEDGVLRGPVAEGMFDEAFKAIEGADSGVKKALLMLLETVLNGMTDDGGKDKDRDMFMFLADSSIADIYGDTAMSEKDMLLAAMIMNRLGQKLEAETADTTEKADSVFAGLEDFVSKILDGDDDTDPNTAADILAAMLNVQPEETVILYAAPEETKAEAVTNAAMVLTAPVKAMERTAPEKVSEAEKLYTEVLQGVTAEVKEPAAETARPVLQVSFAALKISNAAEQLGFITIKSESAEAVKTGEAKQGVNTGENEAAADVNGEAAVTGKTETRESGLQSEDEASAAVLAENGDSVTETKTETDVQSFGAELAAAEMQAAVHAPTETAPTALEEDIFTDEKTVFSVENQVRETVEGEIAELGDKDGTKELVLILKPKELGQIAVKLVKENGAVSVLLSAQYEEVGKMMTQRVSYLGSSLSNQNYEVRDIHVVEPGNAAEQMGLNFTDRGFSFEQSGSQRQGYSGSKASDSSEEIGEIAAINGAARSWEAKLWTTA